MSKTSRRDTFKLLLAGSMAVDVARATNSSKVARGIEGQRRADLGDGTFLNPIVPGDHPDPTILKDGSDYYLTFSSFQYCPGAVIWHSRDLVNWVPICAALTQPLGTVWATDLVKHRDRYYLYLPVLRDEGTSIFVVHADHIRGPWSEPIDLKISGCIDPGHAVGEDGKRYLFINGVRRIGLTDDGLATVGELKQVYDPWRYPADWVVEMFAPEGPKIARRGDWFYLITAVGGTAGPPTSHMVVVARSRSIHGPWQDCPFNPIVRTASVDEPWWSRGHASIVEGPSGDWWMVYHGYENGLRTLGRQTLLEPIEWTDDGWFRARGGTLSSPLKKPSIGQQRSPELTLSDDFSTNRLGLQWSFFDPELQEMDRARVADRSLILKAKGNAAADSSPLTLVVGDRSYEASVTLEIGEGAQGGLLLFYNPRGYCGVGFNSKQMFTFNYGEEHGWMRQAMDVRRLRIKVVNRNNVVTFSYSPDGKSWTQHPWQMEMSGLHHNVFGGFLSLRLGLYCTGQGEVRFRDFSYRGLD